MKCGRYASESGHLLPRNIGRQGPTHSDTSAPLITASREVHPITSSAVASRLHSVSG